MLVIQTIAGTRLDHGGTSRSVPALCDALGRRAMNTHLLTTCPVNPEIEFKLPQPPVVSHLVKESARFGRLTVGRQFQQILRNLNAEKSRQADGSVNECLIHDHGIWLAPNHAVAKFARREKMTRIVSPRGMLSTWAIDARRWKKRLAWWAYQQTDLRSATAFHVTAKLEAEEVRALGFKQPIAVIPNGVSLPEKPVQRQRQTGRRRMLFLSRIHPKKGLIELIRAWKKSVPDSDWELVIAGPNESGYQQQVESEVRTLELTEFVKFPGTVSDTDKWQMYADADLFVLPSFSENFGIVVAEALAAGLPVITTTGTPWEELLRRGCGWWVEPTVDDLSKAIAIATKLPPRELNNMGQTGAAWVRNEFTWDAVAWQMIQFYEWLLGCGSRPNCVDL